MPWRLALFATLIQVTVSLPPLPLHHYHHLCLATRGGGVTRLLQEEGPPPQRLLQEESPPPQSPLDGIAHLLDDVHVDRQSSRYLACIALGIGTGIFFGACGARRLGEFTRRAAPTVGAPVQAALGVVGVLYSVLLGATLSTGMARQSDYLRQLCAELAALESLAEDLAAELRRGTARGAALAALACHLDLLDCFYRRRCPHRGIAWQNGDFDDPLLAVSAELARARLPPTPLGARHGLEQVHRPRVVSSMPPSAVLIF